MRQHKSAATSTHSPLVSPEAYAALSPTARRFVYSYLLSREISRDHDDWYALLCSLIRQADTDNMARLEHAWPDCVAAMRELYYAPL